MKDKLNLTIDSKLSGRAKTYAKKHHTSVSNLVESYLEKLTTPTSKKNILQLLNELPEPSNNQEETSRNKYYEENKKKYGF